MAYVPDVPTRGLGTRLRRHAPAPPDRRGAGRRQRPRARLLPGVPLTHPARVGHPGPRLETRAMDTYLCHHPAVWGIALLFWGWYAQYMLPRELGADYFDRRHGQRTKERAIRALEHLVGDFLSRYFNQPTGEQDRTASTRHPRGRFYGEMDRRFWLKQAGAKLRGL